MAAIIDDAEKGVHLPLPIDLLQRKSLYNVQELALRAMIHFPKPHLPNHSG